MKGPRSTSKWKSVASSRTKPVKDKDGSLMHRSEFGAHESIGGPDVPPPCRRRPGRHMVFVDPQGRTIFSNRRMAEILRGRISNRCWAGQSGFARVSGNIGDPKLAEG